MTATSVRTCELAFDRVGSGPALVLLHPLGADRRVWAPVIPLLAAERELIAVDLPGFGGSAAIAAPLTLAGYGALIAGLLDRLGIFRCMLFGHSLGAMIVQQMALDHPGRFERLVLYGAASTGRLPGRFETFDATIERLRRVGIAAGAEPIIASWFVAGRKHPAFPMYRRMAESASTEAAIAVLRAVEAWQVTERLGEIAAPALVIGGDRDRSTEPAEQLRLWRGLPNGQLCILPGCAHAAHLEVPDLFGRLVERFLCAESRAKAGESA